LDELVTRACSWLADRVDYILLREPDADPVLLLRACKALVWALDGTRIRVLLSGAPQMAAEAGAHGVHLRSYGDLAAARNCLPEGFITRSCHTVDEVERSRLQQASAVLFAPVFGKVIDGKEVVPGVGLELLREACVAAGSMPVFAVGGINRSNAQACIQAGAAGIAGIRMFHDFAFDPGRPRV
jgi:thiamine-phosphate pyrophosphorylase